MNRTDSTSTPFTRLIDCRLPIQLSPMAGAVGPELAIAVARAGGHAMFPAVMAARRELETVIDRLRAATGAFGVNFIAPLADPDCLELAAHRAPLVDLFYGDPDSRTVELIHAGGAFASWQVGSLEEALRAEAAGCDLVVVQGTEAGGRLRGELELVPLLESVARRLEVPILAAGGIATAAGVARAMEAGADGVRVGTRFVAAEESNAHPAWQRALVEAGEGDTVITRSFSVGVPDFPHRVLRRSLEAAERHPDGEPVGSQEGPDERRVELACFSPNPPTRSFEGHVEAMPFYAGRSSAQVTRVAPAADIVMDLAAGVPCAPVERGKARRARWAAAGLSAVAIALSLAAAVPAVATAATQVDVEGDVLTIRDPEGLRQNVRVVREGSQIAVRDSGEPISTPAGSPCFIQSGDEIRCSASGIARIDADLGAADDAIEIENLGTGALFLPSLVRSGLGDDRLLGGAGADRLNGQGGDDRLDGNPGNDSLTGSTGSDDLIGGDGTDSARYDDGHGAVIVSVGDTLANDGNATDGPANGRDEVFGDVEVVEGSPGNDALLAGALPAALRGNAGLDLLRGGVAGDELDGGEGDDSLEGFIGDDLLEGGSGNDELEAGEGDDVLEGGTDADELVGGPGRDFARYVSEFPMTVTVGNNQPDDGDAFDEEDGRKDNIFGDVEEVHGGQEADDLRAGPLGTTLDGRTGNDQLRGGPGPDILDGREGDDAIETAGGAIDQVTCGPGVDQVTADLEDEVNVDCENVDRPDDPPPDPDPDPDPAPSPGPSPGPVDPGPAPAPPANNPAPAARVAIATRALRMDARRRVRIKLSCSGQPGSTCRGAVTMRRGKAGLLARRTFALPAGGTRTLVLTLPRRAARQVRRGGLRRVQAVATLGASSVSRGLSLVPARS